MCYIVFINNLYLNGKLLCLSIRQKISRADYLKTIFFAALAFLRGKLLNCCGRVRLIHEDRTSFSNKPVEIT